MECPKCHSQIEDGSKFCNHCGSLINNNTQCPHCHNEVPTGSNFCNHCGECLAPITKCPLCGYENPAGSRFCTECGSHLFLPAKKSVYRKENTTKQTKQPILPPKVSTLEKRAFSVNGVSFTMLFVEGGTFLMGATPDMGAHELDEVPVHKVTLSSYYIGQVVVTQSLWKAVMGNNPSHFKGENKPVENVSWNDCQRFCKILNTLTGEHFRLPSEAEWEFAARGGIKTKLYRYSGSNNLEDVSWNSTNCEAITHDVAQKQPNELSIYDMSGNVWEWCIDWYSNYNKDAQTNHFGPNSGSQRVMRGGSFLSQLKYLRPSARSNYSPNVHYSSVGFRLVLSSLTPV